MNLLPPINPSGQPISQSFTGNANPPQPGQPLEQQATNQNQNQNQNRFPPVSNPADGKPAGPAPAQNSLAIHRGTNILTIIYSGF